MQAGVRYRGISENGLRSCLGGSTPYRGPSIPTLASNTLSRVVFPRPYASSVFT